MTERNFFSEWKKKKAEERLHEVEHEGASFQASSTGAAPVQADGSEGFQWTEERDKLIQELLETTAPGTLPSVHLQLQAIRMALISETLPPDRARALLAEVNGYLSSHLQAEARKQPVADAEVSRAREEKLNALHAWQQSAEALGQYVEKKETVYLDVAAYAADQGSTFLATSRRRLLENEPEPEEDLPLEDEESFEEEDAPEPEPDPEEADMAEDSGGV